MNVLQVTPSFYPAWFYGGPTVSVYELCRAIADAGCVVRVLTTDANGPSNVLNVDTEREVKLDGLTVRYCHRVLDVSVSPALLRLLPGYIRNADMIHLTAVYSFPTIPTLFLARWYGKPLLWSTRGMLQEWTGTTRRRSKALWRRICRIVGPKRLYLHVTSEDEGRANKALLPGSEVFTAPNGVEIPGSLRHVEAPGKIRLLYLGRIDRKKGIENLIDALALLPETLGARCSLVIAGSGSDAHYTEEIAARVNAMRSRIDIRMVGFVTGDAKRELFAQTDIVVVPSHRENFGIVVAEALAHAVPVIVSRGAPWEGVEGARCGLWVDNDPASLAAAIERATSMPLTAMGTRGREWVAREFSWRNAGEQMIAVYRNIMAQSQAR